MNAQHAVQRWVVTVANLPPAASYSGLTLLVADGANATDCTVGGGSTIVGCKSNGTIWVNVPISGSGGSGVVLQTNGTNNAVQSTLNIVGVSPITASNSGSAVNISCPTCGSGGGASSLSQLTDLLPESVSANAVTFSAGQITVSNTYCNLAGSSTLTLTAGTASDTLYLYVNPSCQFTVGYNSANTYTLTNYTGYTSQVASGIQAVPAGSGSVATCTVTSGTLASCSPLRNIWSVWSVSPAGQGVALAINSSGQYQAALSQPPRNVTVANDTVLPSDVGRPITFRAGTSNVVEVVGQPGVAGNFLSGAPLFFTNYGAGTVTLTPAASFTIGGQTSIVIPAAPSTYPFCSTLHIVSNGTNWDIF